MLALVLLAALGGTKPETAKLFNDRGSTYFRWDDTKALTVGAELQAATDAEGQKATGTAVIMEVNGKLARVSLDDDATKAGAKFVKVPKVAVAGRSAPVAGPPKPSTAPKLNGRLSSGALRIEWSNDSDASWTKCRVVQSDGSFYEVGEVVKHTDDGVMKLKLSSPPAPAYDHLLVRCSEGESRFYFDRPQSPQGSLKGYATNEGRGGVIVHNQHDTAWTGCDVRKPDGSHYVLGTLKGRASDSIAGGRFVKEENAGSKWVELRCSEGMLHREL